MAATITKVAEEPGYLVTPRNPTHVHPERLFIWGDFDCGVVTWQAARAQARRYAAELAEVEAYQNSIKQFGPLAGT